MNSDEHDTSHQAPITPEPPVSSVVHTKTTPQTPPQASPIVAEPVIHEHKVLAISACAIGIFGLLTSMLGIGILFGPIAIILGVISLVKKQSLRGFAIAGIIAGGLAILVSVFVLNIILAFNGGLF